MQQRTASPSLILALAIALITALVIAAAIYHVGARPASAAAGGEPSSELMQMLAPDAKDEEKDAKKDAKDEEKDAEKDAKEPTPTPSPTPSPAPTPTPTPTPTLAPTPTPTPTPTPSPAPTPTTSPSPTPAPTADLKVMGASVNAPSLSTVGVPFVVGIDATSHNNGPATPIDANVVWNLTVPTACTKSPSGTHTTSLSLPQGVTMAMSSPTWTVTCNVATTHSFAARATISPSDPNVTDPTSFNNFRTALGSTTTID
jgi:outer membrane biosynthesis protein TonB